MSVLLAGAARMVITPPVGVPLSGYFVAEGRKETARDVHDDLYTRALVLNDGERTIAIVTNDLIGLGDEEVAMVRAIVQRETAIASECLIIACTHTHSGPIVHPFPHSNLVPGQADEDYFHLLPRLIASTIIMAQRRQRPARIGAGTGTCFININRREILPDGTLRGLPFLGKNPGGITDREVGVLRVDDATTGMPLAVLLSYACHPVVLGPNLEISADYVGYAINFIEHTLGDNVVALFANGAQGDMNAIVHPGTYVDAERLGIMLGAETVQVALGSQMHEDVQIRTATRRTELSLNPAAAPERQHDYIAFLEREYQRFIADGNTSRAWDIEMRLAVANYRRYVREGMTQSFVPAEVTAFGLTGNGVSIGLVSEPAELFCTYGLQTRAQSPFATTLVLGLANGMIGYVPTSNVYTEGGYECEATQVAPGAGEQLCQTMIEALHDVA